MKRQRVVDIHSGAPQRARPAQVRRAQLDQLAAALLGHVGERAQKIPRVAPDPLVAKARQVERAGVDGDPHGAS